MLEPFSLPFVQRGVLEIFILSVPAGLLGTWIVLRGLAFYTHGVGTATFPGLVIADGLGFAAGLGASLAAVLFATGVFGLGRSDRASSDSATAVVLVGALAAGVILASDVFSSGSNVEGLLFGSLLLIDSGDLLLAACASVFALAGTFVFGRTWLARGFDPVSAPSLGAGSSWPDVVLLGLIALAAVAALTSVGALLVGALFVVPAATARLLTRRVVHLQIVACAIAAFEGVAGIWLSVKTDAPPGATIAVISGVVFAAAAIWRWARRRVRRWAPLAGAATAVTLALLVSGCGTGNDDEDEKRVTVVATTSQVADLVRTVAGSSVEVDQILDPNTDPHEYEPRPSDVVATAEADLVFRSGGDLDEWSTELIADSGSDAPLVDLGKGVPFERVEEGETDPHWWHDPRNAESAVQAIGRALAEVDPGSGAAYRLAASRYGRRISLLDAGMKACFDRIPEGQRKLVTDHDSFGYLTDRFGFMLVGTVIPSFATGSQASAGDIADLTDLISEEGVRAVFSEATATARLAEAIARETGASADYELYGDALGPSGSGAETYLEMEEANADAIVRGLTGGASGCEIGGIR